MSKTRTEILEGARRVAYVWNALRPSVQDRIFDIDQTLAVELTRLLDLCTPPASDFPETEG